MPGKPNIVYVFADQMRAHAMGCMGHKYVSTPNMDALAAEGLLFTNAISATPVCSPYRAQLLTGRLGTPSGTGVGRNDKRLPDSEVRISDILKNEGYATGYIGKWHLSGNLYGHRVDPVDAENRRGWDYWAVRNCSHAHSNVEYWLNDATTPISVDGWEPDVQTDLAVDYIQSNKNNSFALMVSFGPPHSPYGWPDHNDMYDHVEDVFRPNYFPPEEGDPGAYPDAENVRKYHAGVSGIDVCIGRIVDALEQEGLADNTILCFSSDHGDMLGSQGYRIKQKPFEEAMNVPFIMRYPGKIAPAKTDYLFSSIDVMPTLLGLCDAPVPSNVHGADLSDLFTGQSRVEQEEVFAMNGNDWRCIRTKEWMYAFDGDGHWVMYNLKDDPYEMNNLVDHPDYLAKRTELRTRLDALRTRYEDSGKVNDTLDPIRLPNTKAGLFVTA